MNGLQVDSVVKSFNTQKILTDIFISCKKGEIIGLLGRNGSGKSTLLKIIFGLLRADYKFVKVDNKIIYHTIFKSSQLIKYFPQNSFLPGHIKIRTIANLFCNKKNAEFIKEHRFFFPNFCSV